MARIFITGSADGLGQLAAKALIAQGHQVVLHARNENRGVNAVDPGWVPTKMGGKGAPDNLRKGYETQVWLTVSNDEKAKVSGRYFHHQKESRHHPEADDVQLQERF